MLYEEDSALVERDGLPRRHRSATETTSTEWAEYGHGLARFGPLGAHTCLVFQLVLAQIADQPIRRAHFLGQRVANGRLHKNIGDARMMLRARHQKSTNDASVGWSLCADASAPDDVDTRRTSMLKFKSVNRKPGKLL